MKDLNWDYIRIKIGLKRIKKKENKDEKKENKDKKGK